MSTLTGPSLLCCLLLPPSITVLGISITMSGRQPILGHQPARRPHPQSIAWPAVTTTCLLDGYLPSLLGSPSTLQLVRQSMPPPGRRPLAWSAANCLVGGMVGNLPYENPRPPSISGGLFSTLGRNRLLSHLPVWRHHRSVACSAADHHPPARRRPGRACSTIISTPCSAAHHLLLLDRHLLVRFPAMAELLLRSS
ncbi:hypothetical protein Dimus_036100 [Dionaea muscipula]